MKSGRDGGEEALKAHPAKGATPRLTAEQQAQIPAVLAKGASAYGFRGEVWNSRRLAVAIKREFGMSYHPDHCGYLVRKMGYSLQKPTERATQRNEQAIERWKAHHWPRLKKKAEQEHRTIVFVDEAGFCQLVRDKGTGRGSVTPLALPDNSLETSSVGDRKLLSSPQSWRARVLDRGRGSGYSKLL
jgi:transposase